MSRNKENSTGLGKRITEATHLSILRTNREVLIYYDSLEKLRNIKPPVIFAVTHLTNWDTTAFIHCLGRDTNIEAVVAHDSTHNNWLRLGHKIALAIAGNKNFIEVSYRGLLDGGLKKFIQNLLRGELSRSPMLNPNDFLEMAKTIEAQKKSLIMAAYYNPDYCSPDPKQVLAPKGGVGVPFLAALTGLPVVPVVVFSKPDDVIYTMQNSSMRPTMHIKVGEPFIFRDEVVDYDALGALVKKREFLKSLRNDSDLLMSKLATLLPEKKRGIWGSSN